jgi:hypothetical protein
MNSFDSIQLVKISMVNAVNSVSNLSTTSSSKRSISSFRKAKISWIFSTLLSISLWSCLSAAAPEKSAKNVNVLANPFYLLIGSFAGELDFQINENWMIGPTFTYASLSISGASSSISYKAFGVGGRARWYAAGNFVDGWYVSPGLGYASVDASTKDSSGQNISASATGLSANLGGGYHWFWEQMNLTLGAIVGLPLGQSKVTLQRANGTTEDVSFTGSNVLPFGIDFNVGFTF